MERCYDSAPHSRSIHTDSTDGRTYIQCVRRYKGIMKDLDCDISNFPFDTQAIEVFVQMFGCPIQTKDPRKLFKIVPCRIEDIRYSELPVQTMLKEGQPNYLSEIHGLENQNWDLLSGRTRVVPEHYEFLGINYCKLMLEFAVQRRWRYFRSKIFTLMSLIVLLCFMSLGFDPDEFEQRVNIVVALMLAMVAFQFTLQDDMPKVHYMTRMDRYVMWHYGFLVAIGAEAFTVFIVHRGSKVLADAGCVGEELSTTGLGNTTSCYVEGNPTLAVQIDRFFVWCGPALYIIYNIYFFWSASIQRENDRNSFTCSTLDDESWTRYDDSGEPIENDSWIDASKSDGWEAPKRRESRSNLSLDHLYSEKQD